VKVPFDDETRVDRFDDETRVDRERGPTGRRLFAAVDGQLVSYPFPKETEFVLGRSPDVALPIDHPSVSRRHTKMRTIPRLAVEDLGSSNGTWVRSVRLEKGEPVNIKAGEVVRLGDVSVWIEQKAGDPQPVEVEKSPSEEGAPVVEDQAMKSLYGLVDRVAPGEIVKQAVNAAWLLNDRPLKLGSPVENVLPLH